MSKYNSLAYWKLALDEGKHADSTKELYFHRFGKFCDFMGKNPNELYDIHAQSLKLRYFPDENTDKRDGFVMENHVKRFLVQLEQQGLEDSSVDSYRNSIKSFFFHNENPLQLKKSKTKESASADKGSVIIGTEHIREIVKNFCRTKIHGNIRTNFVAAIMVMKDTGLRVGDLPKLRKSELITLTHTTESREIRQFWGHPTIITKKRHMPADPVLGEEAIRAIQNMKRARYTEPETRETDPK
jgi:integrase